MWETWHSVIRQRRRARNIQCGRARRYPEYLQPQRSLPSRAIRERPQPAPRSRRGNPERNERLMRFVKSLELGMMLAASACVLHAQAKPATAAAQTGSAKPVAAQAPAKASSGASDQAKPSTGGNTKSAAANTGKGAQAAKPAAKSAATPSGKKQAAKKPASKPSKPVTSAGKDSGEKESRVARRDPFESLVGRGATGAAPTGPLPPGKAGLQVSTLRLDGIVRAPTGMIAVVSNPQAR